MTTEIATQSSINEQNQFYLSITRRFRNGNTI